MDVKACRRCEVVKPLDLFYFRKDQGKHRAECKACQDARNRAWRLAHPEQDRAYAMRSVTKFQRNNRERYLAQKRACEARRRANPSIQLGRRISTAMREALLGGKNRKGWRAIAGYELPELQAHLERQFQPGMSWSNMGKWHIDHIIPLSSFQFTGPDDPELRRAWSLPNLRPLWAAENIRKRDKRTTLL